MRGVVETYNIDTGRGSIKGADGQIYALERAHLWRRSQTPRQGMEIAFRAKNGKVIRAAIPRVRDPAAKWEIGGWVVELLLYLPWP